jgi:DNA (cytosine-5)-methyltransferase 1
VPPRSRYGRHVLDARALGAPAFDARAADTRPAVAEFFAGIGLVRLGLERSGFRISWANDVDPDKKQMYCGHFRDSDDHYYAGDVAFADASRIPDVAMAWASFPCVDVSLAGWRRGLNGAHTGTFWHFIRVLTDLKSRHRLPPVVALENVIGLGTSHGGQDLVNAVTALNGVGYSVDILAIDARHFVPQSRPRLFLVGALTPPTGTTKARSPLRPAKFDRFFHDPSLRTHRAELPDPGPIRLSGLVDYVEHRHHDDPLWWDDLRTSAFLDSLSDVQRARLDRLIAAQAPAYRTAYRRTRSGKATWEIRADEIAGCLRTARGGSSKQALVSVTEGRVKVRWMTAREYANLMGAADYELSGLRPSQVLFGFGDAVCVDVVAWLGTHYLHPLVAEALLAGPHAASQ